MKKTNIKEVVGALGISKRRVYDLIEEGVLPKALDGNYDIKECVAAYLAFCIARDKEFLLAYERDKVQADADAGRPMRWSIALASREFGVPENVLRQRLKRAGMQPSFPPTPFDMDDFADWALKNLHLLKR